MTDLKDAGLAADGRLFEWVEDDLSLGDVTNQCEGFISCFLNSFYYIIASVVFRICSLLYF